MQFNVVMVARDQSDLPAWVPEQLARSGIGFRARNCTDGADFVAFAAEADVVWTIAVNRVVTAETLARLPRCKAVIRSGSGVDGLPLDAATELGIWVANTPESIAESVADQAIALLFAVIRQIPFYDRSVRRGAWNAPGVTPLRWHISGQTLGLIGFGHIARQMASKLSGFRLRIVCHDPFVKPETMSSYGVEAVTLDDLLAVSDFVSVHCPLNKHTARLLGAAEFRRMKKTAIVINTSRGGVLDEQALLHALQTGEIGGAGLDVLTEEPPSADHPLFKLDNVVLSPHIAAFSDEFDRKFWECSIAALRDFQQGRWQEHSVNKLGAAARSAS